MVPAETAMLVQDRPLAPMEVVAPEFVQLPVLVIPSKLAVPDEKVEFVQDNV